MLSVKDVYNKIAPHFDVSRQRVWGSVKLFMDKIPQDALVLDLGCGNGKNMLYRKDIQIVGIDNASAQVEICKKKNLHALEADITSIPFSENMFDYMLSIATYHHLDNDVDRKLALQEMYRCLKPGGRALMVVWALEQHEGSTFHFTKADELVPWTTKSGTIYMRYYHIYEKGALEEEIQRLCPEIIIRQKGWELGNWHVILEKPQTRL
jgi:ubiquinone/menaquinone biosynthesis C-methylase UbiE